MGAVLKSTSASKVRKFPESATPYVALKKLEAADDIHETHIVAGEIFYLEKKGSAHLLFDIDGTDTYKFKITAKDFKRIQKNHVQVTVDEAELHKASLLVAAVTGKPFRKGQVYLAQEEKTPPRTQSIVQAGLRAVLGKELYNNAKNAQHLSPYSMLMYLAGNGSDSDLAHSSAIIQSGGLPVKSIAAIKNMKGNRSFIDVNGMLDQVDDDAGSLDKEDLIDALTKLLDDPKSFNVTPKNVARLQSALDEAKKTSKPVSKKKPSQRKKKPVIADMSKPETQEEPSSNPDLEPWQIDLTPKAKFLNNMGNLRNAMSAYKNDGVGDNLFYLVHNNEPIDTEGWTYSDLFTFIGKKFRKDPVPLDKWNSFVSYKLKSETLKQGPTYKEMQSATFKLNDAMNLDTYVEIQAALDDGLAVYTHPKIDQSSEGFAQLDKALGRVRKRATMYRKKEKQAAAALEELNAEAEKVNVKTMIPGLKNVSPEINFSIYPVTSGYLSASYKKLVEVLGPPETFIDLNTPVGWGLRDTASQTITIITLEKEEFPKNESDNQVYNVKDLNKDAFILPMIMSQIEKYAGGRFEKDMADLLYPRKSEVTLPESTPTNVHGIERISDDGAIGFDSSLKGYFHLNYSETVEALGPPDSYGPYDKILKSWSLLVEGKFVEIYLHSSHGPQRLRDPKIIMNVACNDGDEHQIIELSRRLDVRYSRDLNSLHVDINADRAENLRTDPFDWEPEPNNPVKDRSDDEDHFEGSKFEPSDFGVPHKNRKASEILGKGLPRILTKSTYPQSPLGRVSRSGRSRGATTMTTLALTANVMIVLGNDNKIYQMPIKAKQDMVAVLERNFMNEDQVPWETFLDKINIAKEDLAIKNQARQNVENQRIEDGINRGLTNSILGKYAEIKWSNQTPTFEEVLGVDINKGKIAIAGGGRTRRKRWIPFSFVGEVSDTFKS